MTDRPCPCCSKSNLRYAAEGNSDNPVIICIGCGMRHRRNRWNTRPLEDKLIEALEKLATASATGTRRDQNEALRSAHQVLAQAKDQKDA